METVRAFFAVDLPDATRRAAANLVQTLRKRRGGERVRWVRAEALHVTLRFLGDTPRERVDALARQVGRELDDVAPFELGLDQLMPFPSARRPRVVALTLAPQGELVRLAASVERGVVAAGFDPEPRRFRAHLTLGRIRDGGFPDIAGVHVDAPGPFEVREVVLFRSQLRPEGALYTPLERIALGGFQSP